MDHDWVEAIIQMPTDEFFNTGITTYLWIMNKNKPLSHRDKIMLIDASDSWKQLKKSKGKKRREIPSEVFHQIWQHPHHIAFPQSVVAGDRGKSSIRSEVERL